MKKLLMPICLLVLLLVASCGGGLSLSLARPSDGEEFTAEPVRIYGSVSNADATVSVNGAEVDVTHHGKFETHVNLVEGQNTITIEAVLDDERAVLTRIVHFIPGHQ